MNNKLPNVDFSTVLEKVMEVMSRDLNCIKIGKIESFDSDNQTASVLITIKRTVSESSSGVKTYRQIPILLEVPVVIISGGGSYLQMPIKKDDTCLLMFSDDDIDGWMVSNETTPTSLNRHDLSDAICLVGLNNLTNSISDFGNDKIKLQFSENVVLEMGVAGSSIKGDLAVDGEISSTTMKPANGVTGSSTPTGTVTVINGIVTAVT